MAKRSSVKSVDFTGRSLQALLAAALVAGAGIAPAASQSNVLTGSAAFGDWREDKPGLVRHIRPADLPKPGATASSANAADVVRRPAAAVPQVPAGFKVELLAEGLSGPREMRTAPNGDIFVAETYAGRIRVLRLSDDGSKPVKDEIYASGLRRPFGIAFFPSDHPQWVYIANTDSVVRFHYRDGDLKADEKPETVIAELPSGGAHSTRDIVFTRDGKRMLVSVGSASNDAEGTKGRSAPDERVLGASSGRETRRADVLSFAPD